MAQQLYLLYVFRSSLINIYKKERIVIPRSLRKTILANPHQAHLGIEKTKLRAPDTVFWLGIKNDIEQVVHSCNICLESRNMHAKEPMLTSAIPKYPFQIVGTDLFLWNGQEYIIVVNFYSRFWEIERLRKTDSSVIIQKLKAVFPDMVFLKWLVKQCAKQQIIQVQPLVQLIHLSSQ